MQLNAVIGDSLGELSNIYSWCSNRINVCGKRSNVYTVTEVMYEVSVVIRDFS